MSVPPVKVLHLIPTLSSGGAERQLVNLVNSTSRETINHVVCVIGKAGFFAPSLREAGYKVIELGISAKHPFLQAASKFRRVVAEEKPDVIHSWLYDANISARLANLLNGKIPLVTSLQSPDYAPEARLAGNWNPHKVRGLRMIDKFTARLTKPYFVPCSESVKNSYRIHYGIDEDKTQVIYNSVDPDLLTASEDDLKKLRRELALPADAFIYLNVGRLDKPKNHKLLIEAFQKVLLEIPNAYLLIAGAGNLDGELKKQAEDFQISEKVLFLGRRKDIGALLEIADVFVFPSLLEGLPVALVEAMFKSVACIASRIEVFEEIIVDGETGLLVNPTSADELKEAMIELYKNEVRRKSLGENAFRQAQAKFNAAATAGQWENFYQNVKSKRKHFTRGRGVSSPVMEQFSNCHKVEFQDSVKLSDKREKEMSVQPIKVLHLIPTLAGGGAERQLVNHVSGTSREIINHVVCVIGKAGFFAPAIREAGYKVIELGISAKHPFLQAASKFRRVVAEEKPDVIHSWLYDANISARLANLLNGKILLVTSLHSPDYAPEARLAGNWNPHKVRGLRMIDKFTARLTKPYFVPCSESVKNSYRIHYGIDEDKTQVIYNSVDPDLLTASEDDLRKLRRELALPADAFIYLNVGRLDKPKNHKILIEAFQKVLLEIPFAYLLIAGAGNLDGELKKQAEDFQISEKVLFLGRRKDIGALLETADVFVFPSLLEGFGLALVEAMFKSLACIASRIEVFEEIIVDGETGLLVNPTSADELKEAMIELYKNEARRKSLGENAFRQAQAKFNAAAIAGQWENFYQEIKADV